MQAQYRYRRATEADFWKRAALVGECWLWTGSTVQGRGYGKVGRRIDGKQRMALAHRYAWELTYGPIPDGLVVCHDCPGGDDRLCVNPAHLWLGTTTENNADMKRKGRARGGSNMENRPRGEGHANARLSSQQVLAIRGAAGACTNAAQARHYGVSTATVSLIVRGKLWKHLLSQHV